ncbi:hypothetical protein BJ165DRAFT_1535638 [Panaeolus papilionaceus]|nr:hypothetical protein BJ165DRAFT_1535638 [Panaeolus papilionaceus]
MDDNLSKEYPNLELTGPISVRPVVPGNLPRGSPMVILGPTGAGKSTFIEAFSMDGVLRISSNQLEGFTQSIGTYELENVTTPRSEDASGLIYLVDVPGFADTKLSETSIVSMLRQWMKVSPSGHLGHILYLIPIHNARMSGSHRQVLRTVQAMTGSHSADFITIVTTMWDNLWGNEATTRAESIFNQLQDDIWKDFLDRGCQIVKFYNTQDSALSVLNTALTRNTGGNFLIESAFRDPNPQLNKTAFGSHLQDDLHSRIQNLSIARENLELDLKSESAECNESLKLTIVTQLQEVDRLLAKFTKELRDNFGSQVPSTPSSQHLELPSKEGIFVSVIRSLKCWGEDARRQHDD